MLQSPSTMPHRLNKALRQPKLLPTPWQTQAHWLEHYSVWRLGSNRVDLSEHLVMADPSTLNAVLSLIPKANLDQKNAIGNGLGLAALELARRDLKDATTVQQAIVRALMTRLSLRSRRASSNAASPSPFPIAFFWSRLARIIRERTALRVLGSAITRSRTVDTIEPPPNIRQCAWVCQEVAIVLVAAALC